MKPSDFIHPEDAAALRPMEPPSSAHIPACYVSKLRSSLEYSKKWPRVWLQYACSVTSMFLSESSDRAERPYPSFAVPLVFLGSPYDDSEMARNGFLDEPGGKAEREDGSKVMRRNMQLTDMCSSTYKTVFDALHIDESKEMNIGSSMKSILHSKCNF